MEWTTNTSILTHALDRTFFFFESRHRFWFLITNIWIIICRTLRRTWILSSCPCFLSKVLWFVGIDSTGPCPKRHLAPLNTPNACGSHTRIVIAQTRPTDSQPNHYQYRDPEYRQPYPHQSCIIHYTSSDCIELISQQPHKKSSPVRVFNRDVVPAPPPTATSHIENGPARARQLRTRRRRRRQQQ